MASQGYLDKVNDFCDKLRQRRIHGSLAAAKGTAELLRQLVASSRLHDPKTMLEEVKKVGIRIQCALPIELVIGNIVRRVMHIIREEMEEESEEDAAAASSLMDRSFTQPVTAGGLSRALGNSASMPPRMYTRAFSLHNLLDQTPENVDSSGSDVEGDVTTMGEAAVRDTGGFGSIESTGLLSPSTEGKTKTTTRHNSGISRGERGGTSGQTRVRSTHGVKSPPHADVVGGSGNKKSSGGGAAAWDRKQEVIDGINELIEELKDMDATIAFHAPEHIHANEVILTFGYSRTVLQFLRRGREKRDFQAVVAEGAPTLQGHAMAAELAASKIRTTAVTDAAVFAMMARVNKVIISAHALLADGGVMAPVGTAVVAAAAKRHSVPFVVLVGIYKLTPHFPHEPGVSFNDFKEPSDVLPYTDEAVLAAEAAAAAADGKPNRPSRPFLQIHNPSYDYIPPENISLFLTDHGHGFIPSYVYRQLSEFYHRKDYQLLSAELDAPLGR